MANSFLGRTLTSINRKWNSVWLNIHLWAPTPGHSGNTETKKTQSLQVSKEHRPVIRYSMKRVTIEKSRKQRGSTKNPGKTSWRKWYSWLLQDNNNSKSWHLLSIFYIVGRSRIRKDHTCHAESWSQSYTKVQCRVFTRRGKQEVTRIFYQFDSNMESISGKYKARGRKSILQIIGLFLVWNDVN